MMSILGKNRWECFMRFSLTGVAVIMAAILALALVVTKSFRRATFQGGNDLVLVLVDSTDSEGVKRAFEDGGSSVLNRISGKGVRFARLITPSPWYPSFVASLLCRLLPSEHGLHRGHAFLTDEARTLAEELSGSGFRTFASITNESLLKRTNVLQGFTVIEESDPEDVVPPLVDYLDGLPEYRNFIAMVEIDVDALGGVHNMEAVLQALYEGIGGDSFLERGTIVVMAPGTKAPECGSGPDGYSVSIEAVLAGKPLRIANGKYVLRPVSTGELGQSLKSLALGQGFEIRDAVRTGAAMVTEWAVDFDDLRAGEATLQPPLFYRMLHFDDNSCRYFAHPYEEERLLYPKGDGLLEPDKDAIRLCRARYNRFMSSRTIIPDRATIPDADGPVLDAKLAAALGRPWMRPEYYGCSLHAVEHYRLGVALNDCGYGALAINEMNFALSMDGSFPLAQFTLASIYATIDPAGAGKHYQKFLDRYGDMPEYAEHARKARRFMGN